MNLSIHPLSLSALRPARFLAALFIWIVVAASFSFEADALALMQAESADIGSAAIAGTEAGQDLASEVDSDSASAAAPGSVQVDGVTTAQSSGSRESVTDLSNVRQLISFSKIFLTILILGLAYGVNRLLMLILDNLAERSVRYRLMFKRIAPVFRIIIWSASIYLIIAGVIAPPFETIVAIGASVGIALGLASQDVLRNIFGGVIVILDKPFQVGDKIQVGEHYGEVLSVGLRSSRVVTPDDSIVTIPNSDLMNQSVSNANSGELDCQVVAEIFLPATVDIARVKDLARKAAYASPYLFLNKPVAVVVLNELHERSYVYRIRVKAYVLDIRYEFPFKSNLTEVIVTECARWGWIPSPSGSIEERRGI